MQDLGVKKVMAAKNKIQQLNPDIHIEMYEEKITAHNVKSIISSYDVIADCTDNFRTRYIINDACFHLKKPHVSASIFQFEGQCSLFTSSDGPCYSCLYPELSSDGVQNCTESGVLGVLPGILGTIQATEMLKYILNIGQSLKGRLLLVDALTMQFREFFIERDPDCRVCGENSLTENMIDVEEACMSETIAEISIQEFMEWQKNGEDFVLLDVREPHEYAEVEMGGTLIPIGELPNRLNELDPVKKTIVHCRGGGRSKRGVEILKNAGFADARNLTGGITAWIKTKEIE
jgi:adenylyltransferase/sulfurtransferase